MCKTLSWLGHAAVLGPAGSFLLGHLYEAVHEPKRWIAQGAHVGLQSFTPVGYEGTVFGLLAEHLPTRGQLL